MPIMSMLDQDLYTFSVSQAILELYPQTLVTYRFINRNPLGDMTENFHSRLREQIAAMADLRLTNEEADYLGTFSFIKPQYIAWLRRYRFNPTQVHTQILDGNLEMWIEGPWIETVFWEVPLLALISETYFEHYPIHKDSPEVAGRVIGNAERLHEKGKVLSGLRFMEFGTRRRRNYEYQNQAVDILKKYPGFQGTSNVHLARIHGVKPVGTISHQWTMGISVLEGLRHANRHALRAWTKVYKGQLGIALTDTFGSKAFWEDFDDELSRLYDGVRQDSGDPVSFTWDVLKHYKALGIEQPKKVVYSDGLTAIKCRALANELGHARQINQFFAIGTHLSNDVPGSPALKIVIKLRTCNDIEVVKLSDEPGKVTGDRDAVRVVKYVFLNTPLDNDAT